jgi:hypothetical protein
LARSIVKTSSAAPASWTSTRRQSDFLLTTFLAADLTQPAPTPIVFPQIADGGGYTTQFIFISADSVTPASFTVNFIDDNGAALILGPTP